MGGESIQVGGSRNETSTVILLNGVTGTGAGSWFQLPFTAQGFVWSIVVTGAPASVSVTLEGQGLDGTTTYVMDTSTTTTAESRIVAMGTKFAKVVRANLGTFSGGAAPTMTVYMRALQPT